MHLNPLIRLLMLGNDVESIKLIEVLSYVTEVPTISYDIQVDAIDRVVGQVEYRFEKGRDLLYYGNIGYAIYPPYRGHNYAYKACLLLFKELLKQHPEGLEVYITCNPDNEASKKTIQKLGAYYIDTVDIASDHELYRYGETQKEVYIMNIK